jgi:hypothetical protein
VKHLDYIAIPRIKQIYYLNSSWIKNLGPSRRFGQQRGFSRARIEAYLQEHRSAYIQMVLQRIRRAQAVEQQKNRQAQGLIAWAQLVPLEFTSPLPETLEDLQAQTKKAFLARGPHFQMSPKALTCYLRHYHTSYDFLLEQLKNKPAAIIGYLILKGRVNRMVRELLRDKYNLSDVEEDAS